MLYGLKGWTIRLWVGGLVACLLAVSATSWRGRAQAGWPEWALAGWCLSCLPWWRLPRGPERSWALAILSAGTALTAAWGLQVEPASGQAYLALLFGPLPALALALSAAAPQRYTDSARAWAWWGGGCFLLAFLAYQLPWSRAWVEFPGGRFCALSGNPNQTALYLCGLPFLLAPRRRGLIPALLVGAAGWATGSDALILGWAAAALMLLFTAGRGSPLGRWSVVYLIGLALACGLAGGVGGADLLEAGRRRENITTRWSLWRNALPAIASRPLLGHGPGAYSHENATPQAPFEAHNSWIDWTTNAGLLGLAPLAYLMLRIAVDRRKQPANAALWLSLVCLASAHYLFRQPMFWLYLLWGWRLDEPPDSSGEGASTGIAMSMLHSRSEIC